jgi:L,D-transpeptidase catalytic domain
MRTGRERQKVGAWWPLASAVLLFALLLSACGANGSQSNAQSSRNRLDSELRHAQQMGIPDSMLKPIETQEASVASGQDGWGYSYDNAAHNYDLLYNQVVGIEQQSVQTLQDQAVKDVTALSTIITQRQSQGFSEVKSYQARLTKAFQDLNNAKTPGDYYAISQSAKAQTQALEAMWPAYLKLQDFRHSVDALQAVGIAIDWASNAYTQDLVVFRDAASPDRYTRLGQVIDGQIAQLVADQPLALPYVGAAELSAFQAKIDLLKGWGEQTASFQRQHDTDAQELRNAKSLADYLTLARVINDQSVQLALPFARGSARNMLTKLTNDLSLYQAENPIEVYEYADPARGIGDPRSQFYAAAYSWDPVSTYDDVYTQLWIMDNNLNAMHTNLSDPTPAWQPHQTDLYLMGLYHIMSGQVTIISLREQTARMYDNGKLVYWSYVTTGRLERPSPPGLHHAFWKKAHIEFQPTEKIGSPIRGFPTPINYAVYYADYGYFLHDGWWRTSFGPGTNLPHWDPAAFNGGSHGCVNFPLSNMGWYFNWVQPGTPVLLY